MRLALFWPFYSNSNAASVRGQALAKYSRFLAFEPWVVTPLGRHSKSSDQVIDGVSVLRRRTYMDISQKFGFLLAILYLPVSMIYLTSLTKKQETDIAISSSPPLFFALEAMIVSKLVGIPFIFDVRDPWELEEITHRGFLRNHAKRTIEKLLCRKSDLVLAATEGVRSLLTTSYSIQEAKVKTLYNGVDLEHFKVPSDTEKKIDLIHLGGPRKYYDTERLVKALSFVKRRKPDVSIVFLGCREDEYTKEIRQMVSRENLFSNILFRKEVDHSQVSQELARSKVGLFSLAASHKIAVGVKIFEYLAAGLPIAALVPSDSESAHLIRSNGVGEVAYDTSEYAEALCRLLEDDSYREKFQARARVTVKKFSRKEAILRCFKSYVKPLVGHANERK